MKIHIEKHNTRHVWAGTHYFESYYTDDNEKVFSLTVSETRLKGEVVGHSVKWDDEVPFEKNLDIHPFTKHGTPQDDKRVALEMAIIKHFIEMQVNVFFDKV